jgi:hypothetical protein
VTEIRITVMSFDLTVSIFLSIKLGFMEFLAITFNRAFLIKKHERGPSSLFYFG